MSVGDAVDVVVRDGVIVIVPIKRVRGKYNLQQLISDIPKDYKPDEVDWGEAVGKEVW